MLKTILLASAALALATSGSMAASHRALTNHLMPGQLRQHAVHPPKIPKKDFAVVNADGSVARGRNVSSVDHLGSGIYIVHFTSDKTGCAYLATVGLGGSSGISAPGYATVVGSAADPNGVFMDTYGSTGVNADLGFHLYVPC